MNNRWILEIVLKSNSFVQREEDVIVEAFKKLSDAEAYGKSLIDDTVASATISDKSKNQIVQKLK